MESAGQLLAEPAHHGFPSPVHNPQAESGLGQRKRDPTGSCTISFLPPGCMNRPAIEELHGSPDSLDPVEFFGKDIIERVGGDYAPNSLANSMFALPGHKNRRMDLLHPPFSSLLPTLLLDQDHLLHCVETFSPDRIKVDTTGKLRTVKSEIIPACIELSILDSTDQLADNVEYLQLYVTGVW